jgi:A/G-specific adenine glycosylase
LPITARPNVGCATIRPAYLGSNRILIIMTNSRLFTNPPEDWPRIVRRKLLVWFKTHRRDLPWRRDVTPYTVWISEIMLQQTVVQTVVPFFERWCARFPDPSAIAAAAESEVLSLWEGLGYYSRARNIHRAADIIVQQYGGVMPSDYDTLLRLPGIGDYTAAAIMSIAYGKPHPVVEANVRRVIRRVMALRTWNKSSQARLQAFLNEAISDRSPGAFNEALMEVGQTVCLNRQPRCSCCPLKSACLAFRQDLQDLIPGRIVHTQIRKESMMLLLMSGKGILARRNVSGLFAGLWVLPTFSKNRSVASAVRSLIGRPTLGQRHHQRRLKPRTHYYTRHREELLPVVYELGARPINPPDGWQWLDLDKIDRYPFPSVYRRILDEMQTGR